MPSTFGYGSREAREQLSDAALAERAIDGDLAAFETLLRRHTPLMRSLVARMLRSVSDADDVVQDALILAWRQLSSLQEPASVRAWLMTIASRQALSRMRRRPADLALSDGSVAEERSAEPERVATHNAQLRSLADALDTLTEDQRQCWLLREIAELSYEQIGTELDMSPSTVRGKLARARAHVVARMEGWR